MCLTQTSQLFCAASREVSGRLEMRRDSAKYVTSGMHACLERFGILQCHPVQRKRGRTFATLFRTARLMWSLHFKAIDSLVNLSQLSEHVIRHAACAHRCLGATPPMICLEKSAETWALQGERARILELNDSSTRSDCTPVAGERHIKEKP